MSKEDERKIAGSPRGAGVPPYRPPGSTCGHDVITGSVSMRKRQRVYQFEREYRVDLLEPELVGPYFYTT